MTTTPFYSSLYGKTLPSGQRIQQLGRFFGDALEPQQLAHMIEREREASELEALLLYDPARGRRLDAVLANAAFGLQHPQLGYGANQILPDALLALRRLSVPYNQKQGAAWREAGRKKREATPKSELAERIRKARDARKPSKAGSTFSFRVTSRIATSRLWADEDFRDRNIEVRKQRIARMESLVSDAIAALAALPKLQGQTPEYLRTVELRIPGGAELTLWSEKSVQKAIRSAFGRLGIPIPGARPGGRPEKYDWTTIDAERAEGTKWVVIAARHGHDVDALTRAASKRRRSQKDLH